MISKPITAIAAVKKKKISIQNMEIDYITFGYGKKPLIMIQGLNTRGIKGSALALAYMYRIFAKDYKIYLLIYQ